MQHEETAHERFARRSSGIALAAGGAMVLAGWLLRPVAIEKHVQAEHVLRVASSTDLWIWSYRVLVFGLFIRLGALVGLGSLARSIDVRAILIPGIAISAVALAISAVGESYTMEIVVHALFRFGTDATTEAARAQVLATFIPTAEWASCAVRMGLMFLSLGSLVVAYGLFRGRIAPAWISATGAIAAAAMMMLLMVRPDHASNATALGALSVWHILVGTRLARGPGAARGAIAESARIAG